MLVLSKRILCNGLSENDCVGRETMELKEARHEKRKGDISTEKTLELHDIRVFLIQFTLLRLNYL